MMNNSQRLAGRQMTAVILFMAAILFLAAGRFHWWQAWLFIGTLWVCSAVGLFLVDRSLLDERSAPHADHKKWDLSMATAYFVFAYFVSLLVAGLDAGRYGWSPPVPPGVSLAALGLFVVGSAITTWSMASNKFFSTFVRIQADRGHQPVAVGPYRFVRHPGYASLLLSALALPPSLGSLWAMLPVLVGCSLLVLRTTWEDQTLRRELAGYAEYAAQVRWRLVPGVW